MRELKAENAKLKRLLAKAEFDKARSRVLNVVDDFSRECVLQVVDFSISGRRLARELYRLSERRAIPKTIACDNGHELTSKAIFFWSRQSSVELHFIQPGEPTRNAFVESFIGKFRDYCLDLHWFASLKDARSTIYGWQDHYNHVRPHRSLGKKPPAVSPKKQPDMINLPHTTMLGYRGKVKS